VRVGHDRSKGARRRRVRGGADLYGGLAGPGIRHRRDGEPAIWPQTPHGVYCSAEESLHRVRRGAFARNKEE
jgi:hypothetical protein